ncbi:[Fe]-hydrogenase maturation protein HydG [Naegleria gruberi]|uniref:[Fe]-hydrogenase maturation protein HydG n=1 Tax=Naegleria gruberi TaxID=5762 RepID=D2VXT5_NAEGR|nr:[Fe]-hydrogenase maturation protein HydG [Naegleria gruberi]EFC38395.1 [Fe]-hydrogenase maturation protein HydG [Naegleria gruberi]|eukprot:XP_002671139.1 [Fe]-hydrogenase maturation protein HydG [Naegleria gruberi strain NEG-M]
MKSLARLAANGGRRSGLLSSCAVTNGSSASLLSASKNFHTSIKSQARWSVEREPETLKQLPDPTKIIDEKLIHQMMEETKEKAKDHEHVRQILKRARDQALLKSPLLRNKKNGGEVESQSCETIPKDEYIQGLSLEDTATLLNIPEEETDILNSLYTTAFYIKELIYGNRIVLFAPLYTSNYCVGSCLYCGYRGSNKEMPRSALSDEEVIREVEALQKQGHKRILMLCGESPKYTFEDFMRQLQVAADVKTEPHGDVRRINVEIPQLSVSDFRRLKATNKVGTYILFQETYHRQTHKEMHPFGTKGQYYDRLQTMDKAFVTGLDDVGIGALFGLYDYRFEVLAMLQHANHLSDVWNAGPHTISVPRLKPASGSEVSVHVPNLVSDAQFKKLVAVLRCSVPYTGMILSTRENPDMRRELLSLGISQMSAGSNTAVGGYEKKEDERDDYSMGQFSLGDHRNTGEVIRELLETGYMPSFCTACYRMNRTGEKFMKIAKKGDIQNMCHPNSIMTLAEYLHDYADEKTQTVGWNRIEEEQKNIPSEAKRKSLKKNLERIAEGVRDIYY